MKTKSDKMILGYVISMKNDTFTVDFNHPLAGKNIVCTFTIKSIDKNLYINLSVVSTTLFSKK